MQAPLRDFFAWGSAIGMIRVSLLAALALTGCARADVNSPSLSPRPVEKLGFAEPEVTPMVARADPALDAEVARVRTRLTAAAGGFDTAAAAAARAAARAGARRTGSEAWLDAQSALAQIDDWRAQTTALVGQIDALAVARVTAGEAPYPALVEAASAARDEAERQEREATRLGALVPAG